MLQCNRGHPDKQKLDAGGCTTARVAKIPECGVDHRCEFLRNLFFPPPRSYLFAKFFASKGLPGLFITFCIIYLAVGVAYYKSGTDS